MRFSLILAVLLAASGCDQLRQRTAEPPAEVPATNLPRAMREWNWGGGSCVHASTVMILRWQGQQQLADWWRKRYAGGETSYGLRSKLDAAGVPYYSTENGDPSVLDYAATTRRGAVIFFFPRHSICFVGYHEKDGREFAVLLDNNRIEQFIWIPKAEFIEDWKAYGGFALVPLYGPAPRLPYNAWVDP